MSKEDELRDVLNETAKQVAEVQSNPRTWLSWTVYFLEQLEGQAMKRDSDQAAFKDMLSALQSEIRNRFKTGGWH
jgi:hypothetical protein